MAINYLDQVGNIKKKIDLAAVRFIRQKEAEYNYGRSWGSKNKVFDRLVEFVSRGKCIRGSLFYYVAVELGCKNKKSIIDFAVGLELIHSALLIHDDVMDNDLLRRGEPSMHAQYVDEIVTKNKDLALETAKSVAISVGDLAIFIAFEIFQKALKNNSKNSTITSLLMKNYSLTGLGQIDDVFFSGSDIEPTPEQITRVFLHKTARYTFSIPLIMATLFTNKSKETVNTLDKIGEDLGIVFQMRDDELGFFGKEEAIGKTVGIDIVRNNKTLIRYYLYKHSSISQREQLNKIFGKKKVTKKQLELLKNLAVSSGAANKIEEIKNIYLTRAQKNIKKIKNQNIKKSLSDLLFYLNSRNS